MQGVKLLEILIIIDIVKVPNHLYSPTKFILLDFFVFLKQIMSIEPLVSIITTTYNQKDFIADTIESIINQEYNNWELLIWDDSPNNESWFIIQKYVNKYPSKIHAWHHNQNRWIIWNMEFLLKQKNKNSKYTSFLEWDDIYAHNNISEKMKIFSKYKSTKLVYNNLKIIDEEWNTINQQVLNDKFYKNEIISKSDIRDIMIKDLSVYSSWSSLMISDDILHYFYEIKNILSRDNEISDIYFFYSVAMNFKIYWISDILTYYRRHWNNTSTRAYSTMISDKINLIKFWYDKKIIDKKTYNNVLLRLNTNQSMVYFYKWLKIFFNCLKRSFIQTIKNFFYILYQFIKQ